MPNIGPVELIVILVIALLVLGPGKLPDVGAALGKSIREFRKAATDVQESVRLDQPVAPAAPVAPPVMQAPQPVMQAPQPVMQAPQPVMQVPAPAPAPVANQLANAADPNVLSAPAAPQPETVEPRS